MQEMLDVYDVNKKFIGAAERNVVHAYGLWHKTVVCWLVWDNKLVFQRRSKNLDNNPNKLYTTASGHVSADETVAEAFIREIEQEIGIAPKNPIFLREQMWGADIKKSDGSIMVDRVFSNIYCAIHNGGIEDFKFSDGEVDSVVAIDLSDFLVWSENANGEISGLEWNGSDVIKTSLSANDFLINPGETISAKFGFHANMIKMNI